MFLFIHQYTGPLKQFLIGAYKVEWNGPIHHQGTEVASGEWMSPNELEYMLGERKFMPDHLEVYRRILRMENAGEQPESEEDSGDGAGTQSPLGLGNDQ